VFLVRAEITQADLEFSEAVRSWKAKLYLPGSFI
jgi:hypothetical protein